mmetsp:Transcript_66067/g.193360  ORF Transcript_66067/g.193360 Transcript_66067/m.193360 type:complete len:187 (-) Transcript_66067:97-657(-)
MAVHRPFLAVSVLAVGAWLLHAALSPAFAGSRHSRGMAARTAAHARVTTVDENGRFRFVVSEASAPAPAPAPAAAAPAPAPVPAPVPVPAPAPVPAGPRICEIFVTNPSVGERSRMSVTDETTVDFIITESRKLLGFDQAWIPDSDFKLYQKEDESTPIKGKMGDNDLKPWGPDGTELHLMFEPAN